MLYRQNDIRYIYLFKEDYNNQTLTIKYFWDIEEEVYIAEIWNHGDMILDTVLDEKTVKMKKLRSKFITWMKSK